MPVLAERNVRGPLWCVSMRALLTVIGIPSLLPLGLILAICGFANVAVADTVTFGGFITQSTQDGTSPAANNPGLNNIADGDAYTVTLYFAASIVAPGTYNLTGGSLAFSDPSASASETSFGLFDLTVSPDGIFDDISLLGCLTTGSGCSFGNQLDANFKILAADLNSPLTVAAFGLDPPHPLDLLEDDGTTDIHGSITTYSHVSSVPEPSSLVPLSCALAILGWEGWRQKGKRGAKSEEEKNI
jgi:hypothetical protein